MPTRIRLIRDIDFDCDYISLWTISEIRRQLVFESAVAVGTFSKIVSVDPDFAVAVDAIEFNEGQLPFRSCGNRKRLAIPTDTARQRSTPRTCRILLIEFAFDTPVVRQI